MGLVAERLRGEVAAFDIKDSKGKIIVEVGKRITARHVRLMQESQISHLQVAPDYLIGQVLAKDVVDPWGREFFVDVSGSGANGWQVVSYGADGEPGGEEENADVID